MCVCVCVNGEEGLKIASGPFYLLTTLSSLSVEALEAKSGMCIFFLCMAKATIMKQIRLLCQLQNNL